MWHPAPMGCRGQDGTRYMDADCRALVVHANGRSCDVLLETNRDDPAPMTDKSPVLSRGEAAQLARLLLYQLKDLTGRRSPASTELEGHGHEALRRGIRERRVPPPLAFVTRPRRSPQVPISAVVREVGLVAGIRRLHVKHKRLPLRVKICNGNVRPSARCHPCLLHGVPETA